MPKSDLRSRFIERFFPATVAELPPEQAVSGRGELARFMPALYTLDVLMMVMAVSLEWMERWVDAYNHCMDRVNKRFAEVQDALDEGTDTTITCAWLVDHQPSLGKVEEQQRRRVQAAKSRVRRGVDVFQPPAGQHFWQFWEQLGGAQWTDVIGSSAARRLFVSDMARRSVGLQPGVPCYQPPLGSRLLLLGHGLDEAGFAPDVPILVTHEPLEPVALRSLFISAARHVLPGGDDVVFRLVEQADKKAVFQLRGTQGTAAETMRALEESLKQTWVFDVQQQSDDTVLLNLYSTVGAVARPAPEYAFAGEADDMAIFLGNLPEFRDRDQWHASADIDWVVKALASRTGAEARVLIENTRGKTVSAATGERIGGRRKRKLGERERKVRDFVFMHLLKAAITQAYPALEQPVLSTMMACVLCGGDYVVRYSRGARFVG